MQTREEITVPIAEAEGSISITSTSIASNIGRQLQNHHQDEKKTFLQ